MLLKPVSEKTWYICSATLPSNYGFTVLSLQIKDNNDSLLAYSMHLPLRPGRYAQRIIYTPPGSKTLSLDWQKPQETLPKISDIHFKSQKLFGFQAISRMLIRIGHCHPDFRGLTFKEIKKRLKKQAVERQQSWHSWVYCNYEQTLHHIDIAHYFSWQTALKTNHSPLVTNLLKLQIIVVVTEDTSSEHLNKTLSSLPPALCKESQLQILEVSKILTYISQPKESNHWLLLIYAGDILKADTLTSWVHCLQLKPKTQIVVFDEDNLSIATKKASPTFKPDWNPDLLLSQAYAGRAIIIRQDLLQQLDGFRLTGHPITIDTLLDDLLLRLYCFFGTEAKLRIQHIPRVLLHTISKMGPRKELLNIQTLDRQQRLQLYLNKAGYNTKIEPGLLPGSLRVRWPLPDTLPLVSLLVPTRNGIHILKPCINALLNNTSYRHFELLIIDNQSDCPATLSYLDTIALTDSRVRILHYDHPFNFSAINNFAATQARGTVLGLINNDIEPSDPEWLSEMVSHVCRPDIGCVGAKLYYPNGRIQHAGIVLGIGGIAGHGHRFFKGDDKGYLGRLKLTQNYSAVTAACMLVKKSVFKQVGGMNEQDLAVNYNDVDFCLKVQALGYRNLWTPYAKLIHHESVSRGMDRSRTKRIRSNHEFAYMRKKWGPQLDTDPAYNANLTLIHEDFSLRCISMSNKP